MDDKQSNPEVILEFKGACVELKKLNGSVLHDVSFMIRRGELLLMQVDNAEFVSVLGDMAEGLIESKQGVVLFRGKDWKTMSADQLNNHRAVIGRVFDTDLWLHGKDLEENILLCGRHHERCSSDVLKKEAHELARLFGFGELPAGLPEQAQPGVLIRAAYVRAFLEQPDLLILENPLREEYDLFTTLLHAVHEAQERGAAIMWIETDSTIWGDARIKASQGVRIEHARFYEALKEDHGATV
ncbi:MAG: hypothetical protein H0X66_18880 [Verrucomicrobia bacterium]|nr:hypothetical protein [Verrucomicrobiota bacterium]